MLGLLALPVFLMTAPIIHTDDHPIVTLVKSKLKDGNKPFTLMVTIQAKAGQEAKVVSTFAPCVKASRKDKGCILYDLHADPDKPHTYVLIEKWQNLSDLEKHLQAAHTQTLLKTLPELLEGPPDVRVLRAVE